MIKIKPIIQIDRFKKLSAIWNSLLQQSGSNTIFSTFEWLCTWWECYGQDKKLFILLAENGEEVIGIAPLMIGKRKILRYLSVRVVSFIGTSISDYADFIIVGEREKVLRLFFRYLQENKDLWDEVDLREIQDDSRNITLISSELRKNNRSLVISKSCRCPYIKTNQDWNSYYSSLSKNLKQDIRTQYNRIKRNDLTHSFSSSVKEINTAFLNNLIDMHLNGIAEKNKITFLETENGKAFLKAIINEFGKKGWLTINVMYINDEIAAYALGFQYGNSYYYWNIGKNSKYDNYSPGKLLLHHMLIEYFSNNSIEEFDLLRGEEDYKYRWTKLDRKNYMVYFRSNSLYSMVVFKLYDSYHHIVKIFD